MKQRVRPAVAPIAAFVTAVLAYAISQAWAGRVPFGPHSSAVNDLATQFVPMTAHFWDVVHGRSSSDLFYNWNAGLGYPFWSDYAAYLSSPLNALAMWMVPRDQVEVALVGVVMTKFGLAAATMTHLLRRLRPGGPAALGVALGVAYGTCGWAVDDGGYVPMWLDGLWGLPLLVLAGLWARENRRPVLGVLTVTVIWWSNFYTAYMATLGALLITLLLMLADGLPARRWPGTFLRLGWRTMVGGLLTGVLLIPMALTARDTIVTSVVNLGWYDALHYLVRFLPLTEGAGLTPSLTFGAIPFVAAVALVLHPGATWRERLVLPVGLALVVASTAVPALMLVWHLGTAPNGSPWREAFVVAGLGVITAWVALSAPTPIPAWRAALAALALPAIWYVVHDDPTLGSAVAGPVLPWTIGACVVAVLCAALARLGSSRGRQPLIAAAVAIAAVAIVAEQVVGSFSVVQTREARMPGTYVWAADAAAMGTQADPWRYDGDQWPDHRVSGRATTLQLDGLLYGVPSVAQSSSAAREDWGQTVIGLGLPWYARGRIVDAPADPGLDPLLGVNAQLVNGGVGPRTDAFPVVRLLPARDGAPAARDDQRTDAHPFAARNDLVAAPVYTVPRLTASVKGKAIPFTKPILLVPGQDLRVRAACAPGSRLQIFAPGYTGGWQQAGFPSYSQPPDAPVSPEHGRGVVTDGILDDGDVDVTFQPTADGYVPPDAVGCLDEAALRSQIDAAGADRPTVAIHGTDVTATYAAPHSGDLLVATPLQAGWTCRADGADVTPDARAGLLAVPIRDARSVSCGYHQPYLPLGAGVSAGALALGLLGLLVRRATTRRAAARTTAATTTAAGSRAAPDVAPASDPDTPVPPTPVLETTAATTRAPTTPVPAGDAVTEPLPTLPASAPRPPNA